MYSLLSGLLRWWCTKEEYHIALVGVDNAGKTTFLEQSKGLFAANQKRYPLDSIPPTVGMNLASYTIDAYSVVVWDLSGRAAMRTMWEQYMQEADGILFVVDSADAARLPEAADALEAILMAKSTLHCPVCIFGNKADKRGALSGDELRAPLRFDSYRNKLIKLFHGSALTCDGVEAAVMWLLANKGKGNLDKK